MRDEPYPTYNFWQLDFRVRGAILFHPVFAATPNKAHILHQATGSRGYTGKTRLRGFQTLDFALVRLRGLRLYSRDFALARARCKM
ncbi:hypothetical protein JYQ62_03930 [Nostoc sp. UHCC 0702]|nr:hypothetical protein JYQ62_03930 [Nostoc sp. UHCC 0702]